MKILLTVLLLILVVYAAIKAVQYLIKKVCKELKIKQTIKPVSGGYASKPSNVLIVDVANAHAQWYKDTYKHSLPRIKQSALINSYLRYAAEHYRQFKTRNHMKSTVVTYVIKNYRHPSKDKKMSTERITSKQLQNINNFTSRYPNTQVAIAEDYSRLLSKKWKNSAQHYFRGRDDYLCFVIAQKYKKQYVNAVIMSNDKYKDFEQFGFIPKFTATTFAKNKRGKSVITPKPNKLGQLRDYNRTPVSMNFTFSRI